MDDFVIYQYWDFIGRPIFSFVCNQKEKKKKLSFFVLVCILHISEGENDKL